MIQRLLILIAVTLFLTACTRGKLFYTNAEGNRIKACDVEFTGLPSVDKFAVEYALSFCAKTAIKNGHVLDPDQKYLLTLDTSIPQPPCGESWDHELAKAMYKEALLTKQQYGYIVAHIDLGLSTVHNCSSHNKSG